MKIFSLKVKGQSLLEVIVALAIFSLISASVVTLVLGSFNGLSQGGEQTEAEGLAQEAIEAVRSVRDGAWNELISGAGVVSVNTNEWVLNNGISELINGKFTRTITFDDVCRDSNANIVSCPGSYVDPESKEVDVAVTWSPREGATNTVKKTAYITDWDSIDWKQNNWSGGSGQSNWSDSTKYSSDDGNIDNSVSGQVSLVSNGGSCGTKTWDFNTPSNYTYNSSEVEVTNSFGQLLDLGNGLNDIYTVGLWHLNETSGTILDYSGNNNNLDHITGTPLYSQTGEFNNSIYFNGSSEAHINSGQQTNLDITGPITVDAWFYKTQEANSNEAIITKWRENGNKRSFALIIDSNNKLEFWVSNNGLNKTKVVSGSDVPLNTWVHAAGVYDGSKIYIFQNGVLKNSKNYNRGISSEPVFVGVGGAEAKKGSMYLFKGKLDEVRISNVARYVSSFVPPTNQYGYVYASDNPTISPTASFSVSKINYWESIQETATKNGGEVYYQLSSDDGNTWQYWNGASWATAGASNYNTMVVINSNIQTFSTSTKKIMFKAFLSGNGTQQVKLDNININCGLGAGNSYVTSGSLTSSAFDMADNSPVQVLSWDQDVSACPVTCQIKLQLRTAPDSGGTPGTWTDWYGGGGINTYFTNFLGTVVSTLLNGNRWVQYRAFLVGDVANTPILKEIRVNYK